MNMTISQQWLKVLNQYLQFQHTYEMKEGENNNQDSATAK